MPPKMAAPVALASALCHLAVLALLMQTRVELSAVRGATQRRLLDSSDPDALVSTLMARLDAVEGMHAVLEETLGSRLTAVEKHHSAFEASLKRPTNGQAHTEDGARTLLDSLQLTTMQHEDTSHMDATKPPSRSEASNDSVTGISSDSSPVQMPAHSQVSDQWQQESGEFPVHTFARRMQTGSAGVHEGQQDIHAEPAYILKRTLTRLGPVGSPHGNGDHRRVQTGGDGEACSNLSARANEVTEECCDEPGEDCTGGMPHTCNNGCAAVFLPFWEDCRSALGTLSHDFEAVASLCELQDTVPASTSLLSQLNVQCSDGTAAPDCLPDCSEAYHGFLLLLNIDGSDLKLSCEVHRHLYSWVGGAVRASISMISATPETASSHNANFLRATRWMEGTLVPTTRRLCPPLNLTRQACTSECWWKMQRSASSSQSALGSQ